MYEALHDSIAQCSKCTLQSNGHLVAFYMISMKIRKRKGCSWNYKTTYIILHIYSNCLVLKEFDDINVALTCGPVHRIVTILQNNSRVKCLKVFMKNTLKFRPSAEDPFSITRMVLRCYKNLVCVLIFHQKNFMRT